MIDQSEESINMIDQSEANTHLTSLVMVGMSPGRVHTRHSLHTCNHDDDDDNDNDDLSLIT